jgi:hypothetical protein
MAWFLRAVELPDNAWACRFSGHEYDRHETIEQALEHLRALARTLGPAELFAHHADGRVVDHGRATP